MAGSSLGAGAGGLCHCKLAVLREPWEPLSSVEGSSSFSVIEPILTHLSISLANPLRKQEGTACQKRPWRLLPRRGEALRAQKQGWTCPEQKLLSDSSGCELQQAFPIFLGAQA